MSAISRVLALGLTLILIGGQLACACGDEEMFKNANKERAEQVRQLMADKLTVGATSQVIEEFFVRYKIAYTYDRFANRYQAIIRDVSSDPSTDQAVSILVHLDQQKRFVRAEVHDTFTAP